MKQKINSRALVFVTAMLAAGACGDGTKSTVGTDSGSSTGPTGSSGDSPTGSSSGDQPTGGSSGSETTGSGSGSETAGSSSGGPTSGSSSGDPTTGSSGASEGTEDTGGSLCTHTGGTESTSLCCTGSGDFPDSCLIGACGCAPDDSHEVKSCSCPVGKCYDATMGCIDEMF